jgi:Ti-type conjugative transfer relaxase TraA
MNPRINVGNGVSGAVRYVLGEGRDPKTGELKDRPEEGATRVAWIGGTGFSFEIKDQATADLARKIMEFDALNQGSKTKKCEQDCVHLTLSWARGEQPTREEMEEAARDALSVLGMKNAKAVIVAHNDEDYAHVHIVASKINPATGRAYDLARSQRTLSTWAERYEREHGGIMCTRRETANELRAAIASRDAGAVLEALTKQRSTFTGAQLDTALKKEIYAPIGASAEQKRSVELMRAQFANKILDHADAVHLAEKPGGPTVRYSTRGVIEAELYVLRAAEGLALSTGHHIDDKQRAAVLSAKRYDGISREQARAFRHATGAEGLTIIDGQAGTGKSFTMGAIREAYEAAGHRVIGLAPTNAVAQDMQADGFARAGTVHSELFALNNGRTSWDKKTVVMVDEAAMLDTKLMAMVTSHAQAAGAKLILIGDDRQLSSVDRGGMFGALKDRHGAAELSEVRRHHKIDDRRAAEMMAEGNFHDALNIYQDKGAIHWTRTQGEARAELVGKWAKDSAEKPDKTRFVFAYTNEDVKSLNAAIRDVRKERGELEWQDHALTTAHGRANFSAGDRIQFTGTDKKQGIFNGQAGTIEAIDGKQVSVRLDGRKVKTVTFDAASFDQFRHGYAGTIYRGQGRTLDQTYLYHSEHWRSAAGYVALTRHRESVNMFVARNTAKDVKQLGRQMGRTDDRRAASQFHHRQPIGPVRPLTPDEILARFADPGFERKAQEQGPRRREPPDRLLRLDNPRPKPPWPSAREKRQQATPEPAETRKARGAASHGEQRKHAPTPAAADRQGQSKPEPAVPLSAAELAERVRRILENPVLEKAERDHRVLHALEERREQLGKTEPVKQDNERPAVESTQEPEKTQSSAERDRKEADYIAGKQEMTDAKAENYDRFTGEKLGGEQKGQTRQTARSAGRSLGRRRSR